MRRAALARNLGGRIVLVACLAAVALVPHPAPAQPFVYVTDSFLDRVLVIDPATDSLVTTVPVGDEPNGLAVTPDGGRVFVVNRDSDTVSVPATWRCCPTAPAPTSPTTTRTASR